MRTLIGFLVLTSFAVAADTKNHEKAVERLNDSAAVLQDLIQGGDKGIPADLLHRAHCAIVVPSLKKGAFIVGGQYGRGFMTCRRAGTGWSAPAAVRVEGGSVGFQIGGSETDVVMLVMNPKAVDKLLSSKFTLGAEGEVAAGPVGRTATAETDALMRAEILSWSRSRGVFAGVSLKGATMRPDADENEELYGKKLENREIITSTPPPPEASRLLGVLNKYSPQEKKG